MADLKAFITNAEDLAVNQLCTIAHLDKTGSLDSRKERLSSFLAGPTRRQRSGWLQFFLHVVDSDAVGPGPDFEVDYDKLVNSDQELLSDYIQYYHLGGAFLRAPPVDVLADLQISPNEEDDERDFDYAVPCRCTRISVPILCRTCRSSLLVCNAPHLLDRYRWLVPVGLSTCTGRGARLRCSTVSVPVLVRRMCDPEPEPYTLRIL